MGGGLIKPMQHRWERVLNRAETETSLAAEKVRAHRASRGPTVGRDANAPGGFEQPAYGGAGATADVKTPESAPTEPPPTATSPSAPKATPTERPPDPS
jgi:hypothetical protein